MNRMIGCALLRTASITPLRRCSNSPFMLAPACNRPRSSTRRITSCNDGGTSPAAMRRARPSTTAVLPTPGAPTRIGLFCRRRRRMSTHWRISPSRPTMGSMRPARASAVRSWVYWSSSGSGALSGLSPPAAGRFGAGGCSREAWIHSSRLACKASWGIRSSDDALFSNRARRSSRSSKASSSRPERICAWPSTLACTTASSSRPMVCADSAGVRVLPALNSSSDRLISATRASRSRPKRGSRQAKSPPSMSSSSSSRCSIST